MKNIEIEPDVIVFSDLHADIHRGDRRLVGDVDAFLKWVASVGEELGVTRYVFTGDLFHAAHMSGQVGADALGVLVDNFLSWHRRGWILRFVVGNHDRLPHGRARPHALDAFMHLFDQPVDLKPWREGRFVYIPYTDDLDLWRRWYDETVRSGDIVFMHQYIGGLVPRILDAEAVAVTGDVVALSGHFHLAVGEGPIVHVGAARPLNFGDIGHAGGIVLLETGSGRMERLVCPVVPGYIELYPGDPVPEEGEWYVRLVGADEDFVRQVRRQPTVRHVSVVVARDAAIDGDVVRPSPGSSLYETIVERAVARADTVPRHRRRELKEYILKEINAGE